ncbi:sensor histidine kinase [Streptomyces sp. NPDC057580]|uniref:sensor histidine kinase n=1 Tax=Streptomyces sp. NPDC057580 TaxID=3346173 RepID=UPI00368F906F
MENTGGPRWLLGARVAHHGSTGPENSMMTNWQRYANDHPRGVDAAVALLLFVVSVPGSVISGMEPAIRAEWWIAVLFSAVGCASLLWNRSHPRTVVVVTAACAVATGVPGFLLTPLLLGPVMVALYRLAVGADRTITSAYTLTIAALLTATTLLATRGDQPLILRTINPTAWILLSAVLGSAVQLRRAYLEVVQARAAHAERMRIARELHDAVAHHLTLAHAQAGTAAHLARIHPEQAQTILADLVGTTSSALRELKATVGLLRQADDTDALAPAPGLAQLADLTDSFASAGLIVTVTSEGEEQRLSPAVDLTAFRIVQEALTNVTKHATAHAAHVQLDYTRDGLTVTITDDGKATARTTAARSGGFGLIGMRERAHSVGGHLHAGHRSEGGFHVTAQLPLHPRNPEEGFIA